MPRTTTIIAIVALCLLCAVYPVTAQTGPIVVNVNAVFPSQPQIGEFSTATVTVTNSGNLTVQLIFVGVHFEWDSPVVWFIGGHSGEGAILGAGENISYDISVGIPANVTTGAHKFFTLVKYRTRTAAGNWTGETDLFWVQPIQISATQASSSTTPQGPQETFTPETIALLIVATGAGLFLERDSVKTLFRKPASKTSKKRVRKEVVKVEEPEKADAEVKDEAAASASQKPSSES